MTRFLFWFELLKILAPLLEFHLNSFPGTEVNRVARLSQFSPRIVEHEVNCRKDIHESFMKQVLSDTEILMITYNGGNSLRTRYNLPLTLKPLIDCSSVVTSPVLINAKRLTSFSFMVVILSSFGTMISRTFQQVLFILQRPQ